MPKSTIPRAIQQFWSNDPTEYTHEDMLHFEPNGLDSVFLKKLCLKSSEKPPIETYHYITSEGQKYKTIDGLYYAVVF